MTRACPRGGRDSLAGRAVRNRVGLVLGVTLLVAAVPPPCAGSPCVLEIGWQLCTVRYMIWRERTDFGRHTLLIGPYVARFAETRV